MYVYEGLLATENYALKRFKSDDGTRLAGANARAIDGQRSRSLLHCSSERFPRTQAIIDKHTKSWRQVVSIPINHRTLPFSVKDLNADFATAAR